MAWSFVRTRFANPLFVFAVSIFLSAWLLFQIQPMFAKLALPLLGGAASVWNTALVFFQATLLLGYLYAHFLTTRLPLKFQIAVHAGVLVIACLCLPVGIDAAWRSPPDSSPVAWLIGLMAVSVGLPFFALSATSPLLQRWFSATGDAAAQDPYFLYGVSNAGSLLALIAYPLVIEPQMAVDAQSRSWAYAFGFLVVVIVASGWIAAFRRRTPVAFAGDSAAPPADIKREAAAEPARARMRLQWLLLSMIPSGLLVAVTTLITTDVVAIPLFWIVPLTLYLLSFVVAFARRPIVSERGLLIAQVPLLVIVAIIANWEPTKYYVWVVLLLLAMLFVTATVCHCQLARLRPATRHLTEFYGWMSAGGILGSAFAALLAPLLFDRVIEISLLCALAAFLRPYWHAATEDRPASFRLAASAIVREVSIPIAGLVLLQFLPSFDGEHGILALSIMTPVMIFTIVFTVFSAKRPLRFGLGVAMLAILGLQLGSNASAKIVHRERTFYATHVIKRDAENGYLYLVHGTTVHGAERLSAQYRREPQTYYHGGTGIGRIFAALAAQGRPTPNVGAIGLGAGELACYRRPGENWTFFEIDPAVKAIAASGKWFHFLPDCAPEARIVFGDGRLTLAREAAARFDLLVLDAFTSDSIPIHLVTREAFALYIDKLAPGGILLVHISNRYIDLEPVLAALAADAKLASRLFDTDKAALETDHPYRHKSTWIAMSRNGAQLAALTDAFDRTRPNAWGRWRALKPRPGLRLWTDDYSNFIGVIKF